MFEYTQQWILMRRDDSDDEAGEGSDNEGDGSDALNRCFPGALGTQEPFAKCAYACAVPAPPSLCRSRSVCAQMHLGALPRIYIHIAMNARPRLASGIVTSHRAISA